jgi:CheY-like chemotaxis protein
MTIQRQGPDWTIQFEIRDTGIGIHRDAMPLLFSMFSQVDSSAKRRYEGAGLGLIICKRLVEMMGGEIWLESEPGQGSTFCFTVVARARIGEHDNIETPDVPMPLHGYRVLVVDDDSASSDILKRILESLKFSVDTVPSGTAALWTLRRERRNGRAFQFVLLDWKMPEMDGIETARKIRGNEEFNDLPLILMTGYAQDEVRERALKLGLSACVAKPIKPSVLLDTILDSFGYASIMTSKKTLPLDVTAKAASRLRGSRVLLVEDNEINQRLACELLGRAGVNVEVVDNGQSAITAVKRSDYDAVLMDIQIPIIDGYDATRMIRQDIRYRSLPIIAMTANVMKGDREKCLSVGMNAYVAKPIDPNELYTTLAAWVSPGEETVEHAGRSEEHGTGESLFELPETIPGINIQSGLDRCGGNGKLFLSMLRSFRDKRADTITRVKDLLKEGDLEAAQRLVHSLKGVSGNLSAELLFAATRELESALIQKDEEMLSQRLNDCEIAFREVMRSLHALGRGDGHDEVAPPPLGAGTPDYMQAKKDLWRLDALIQGRDFTSVECVQALMTQLHDTTHREDLRRLEEHLDSYDFKSARRTLLQLAKGLNIPLQEDYP